MTKTQKHYDHLAPKYDNRYRSYLEHTHCRFLDEVEIDPDDAILDLSCGTGLLAKKTLDQHKPVKKLVLNDFSGNMLQKAKERLKDYSKVTFSNYSADKLGFSDQTFTKIFCLNSFHYYHHQQEVSSECRRVLQPTGKLYILDWNRSGWFRLVNKLMDLGGKENINTKSASEAKSMLQAADFSVLRQKEWRYKWWKFYYLITL